MRNNHYSVACPTALSCVPLLCRVFHYFVVIFTTAISVTSVKIGFSRKFRKREPAIWRKSAPSYNSTKTHLIWLVCWANSKEYLALLTNTSIIALQCLLVSRSRSAQLLTVILLRAIKGSLRRKFQHLQSTISVLKLWYTVINSVYKQKGLYRLELAVNRGSLPRKSTRQFSSYSIPSHSFILTKSLNSYSKSLILASLFRLSRPH
jgi:hypothetical protein